MESFFCAEFKVRTMAKIFIAVLTQTGKSSSQELFVPTLDLNHTTVISPVQSKTVFRQLARTPRDFVDKTCLIGALLIDIESLKPLS